MSQGFPDLVRDCSVIFMVFFAILSLLPCYFILGVLCHLCNLIFCLCWSRITFNYLLFCFNCKFKTAIKFFTASVKYCWINKPLIIIFSWHVYYLFIYLFIYLKASYSWMWLICLICSVHFPNNIKIWQKKKHKPGL